MTGRRARWIARGLVVVVLAAAAWLPGIGTSVAVFTSSTGTSATFVSE